MIDLALDHVAIAVPSLEDAAPIWERLSGADRSPIEEIPAQGVRVCFVGSVELIEPLGPDGGVARFLQRRGSGLHHIAWRSDDIVSDLRRLVAEGYEAIDAEPREGARGHRVAFLHPRSTGGTLVELVGDP